MFITLGPMKKLSVSGGGEREKGGHVLKDTTSRGLRVRVRPPNTIERRGGGGCEQLPGGWRGGEGRAREWTGGDTPHPSMLRLIRIVGDLAAPGP